MFKSVQKKHFYLIGEMLGTLQKNANNKRVKHRNCWDAEGLIGSSNPKFGLVNNLSGISKTEQKEINQYRSSLFRKIKKFELKFPERRGLIHADLHFGNLLINNGELGAIDFDDCGYGFFGYDLAIPLLAAKNLVEENKNLDFETLQESLIEGYSEVMPFDNNDRNMIPCFMKVRQLTMLGWLQSRSDHPRLKARVKKQAKLTLSRFKNE